VERRYAQFHASPFPQGSSPPAAHYLQTRCRYVDS